MLSIRCFYADGSVILWDIRDLSHNQHKTLRVNIEFDHASFVSWSPDSKAFIIHTVQGNNIVVYKIDKKKDGALGSATQVVAFDKVSEFFNSEQIIIIIIMSAVRAIEVLLDIGLPIRATASWLQLQ